VLHLHGLKTGNGACEMKEFIAVLLILLFPYTLLGEEAAVPFLICSFLVMLILNKGSKSQTYNKIYILLLSVLFIYSFTISLDSVNPVRSAGGSFMYLLAMISYIAFKRMSEKKIALYFVMLSSFIGVTFVMIQGVLMDARIYGVIGYANTFALILLNSIWMTDLLEGKYIKWIPVLSIALITGIFYTGDRVSIFLLVVWGLLGLIKKRNLNRILLILFSAMEYMCFELLGIASFLLSPLFTIIIYYLYQFSKKLKLRYQLAFMMIPVVSLFFFDTNTIDRLRNISLTNGSLVERYISFQDAISQSVNNLFGSGINSYEYMQYVMKSAFYESKYIHNTYLQYMLDLGLIGVLLFLVLNIYIFVLLLKSKNTHKEIYLGIYLIIVIHGLMNFDSVFGTYWLLLSFLVATSCRNTKPVKVHQWIKVSSMSLLFITSLFLFVYEGSLELSSTFVKKEKGEAAAALINVPYTLNIPDDRIYITSAAIKKQEYTRVQDTKNAENVLEDLYKAEYYNPIDPRIKWNIAYIHMVNNDFAKAGEYWDRVLALQWHNNNTYAEYSRYLEKAYEEDKATLAEERERLKKVYEMNIERLNPLSKYLPNQLKNNFDQAIEQDDNL
jgi:O-Antigen ligase